MLLYKVIYRHTRRLSFHLFPFKAVPPFASAFKRLLCQRALKREGETFTKWSKNQPFTYYTVSCSLWAQRAAEWINPTHYSQRTSEIHVQRGNLPSWPFNLLNIPHIPPPTHTLLNAVLQCKCRNHLRISSSRHDFMNGARWKWRKKECQKGLDSRGIQWQRQRIQNL